MGSRPSHEGQGRLFVDCGSNVGQGYAFFKKCLPPARYDAVLIEPNPNCIESLEEQFGSYPNLEIMQDAAWVRNEKLKLCGLVEDERGAMTANEEAALEVDAFSLGELLKSKAEDCDEIVVKMDIESSEYEVLRDLLDTGAAKYIAHILSSFIASTSRSPSALSTERSRRSW